MKSILYWFCVQIAIGELQVRNPGNVLATVTFLLLRQKARSKLDVCA